MKSRILVVDDELGARFGIGSFLKERGFDVVEAEDARTARQQFSATPPDAAVMDYVLPDGNALELLRHFRSIDATFPAIVLTGNGSIELAVRAIKEGAEYFLTKPVELPALGLLIERSLAGARRHRAEMIDRYRQDRDESDPFFGQGPAILALAEQAKRLALSDRTIFIRGETGTGKGVLARWLHRNSPRRDGPFVDLNCGGLSREFLSSELFGHDKGAFTGAASAKPGLLELADRGTLFLDEIGDMPAEVQPQLLKVLEEKRFRRLGEVHERRADVRLIVATHKDLGALADKNEFRQDLFFRISGLPLVIPPLRERPDEALMLARLFVAQLGRSSGRTRLHLADQAEREVREYAWPGNIRQLRNVIERAVLLCDGDTIEARMLDLARQGSPSYSTDLTLAEVERRHVQRVLDEEGGHVERAAQRLGIPRSSLYQRLKRLRPG
jgi:DNA-binding NtrC family response regulator